jgi:hypothetical protein
MQKFCNSKPLWTVSILIETPLKTEVSSPVLDRNPTAKPVNIIHALLLELDRNQTILGALADGLFPALRNGTSEASEAGIFSIALVLELVAQIELAQKAIWEHDAIAIVRSLRVLRSVNTEAILHLVRCCSCGARLGLRVNVVGTDRRAAWDFPTMGNVETGESGQAVAFVCDACVKDGIKPSEAVEFLGETGVQYHQIAELKPLKADTNELRN